MVLMKLLVKFAEGNITTGHFRFANAHHLEAALGHREQMPEDSTHNIT